MNGKDKLAKQIGWAVLLGMLFGFILFFTQMPFVANWIKPVGDVFIRLLKMVILPLVFSSIFMSVIKLGDPGKLGKIGWRTFVFFTSSTFIAISIGMLIVNLTNPGLGASFLTDALGGGKSLPVIPEKSLLMTIFEVIINSIPTNVAEAFAKGDMLQVIVFSLIAGAIGLSVREKIKPLENFMLALEDLSHQMTKWVMSLAPYGIFSLMTYVIASSGLDALLVLAKYAGTVVLALMIHMSVLIIWTATLNKKSPLEILKAMAPALLTAFSTSSSAATLPVSIETATERLDVEEEYSSFVLPLGATVNMDGTALYIAVASVFIGQIYGVDLTLSKQIMIFMTAALASVGTAAIPSASLVTIGIVLTAVGIPLEGIQVIIAMDRILDMFRTTVNVSGDMTASVTVQAWIRKRLS